VKVERLNWLPTFNSIPYHVPAQYASRLEVGVRALSLTLFMIGVCLVALVALINIVLSLQQVNRLVGDVSGEVRKNLIREASGFRLPLS
jgi:hypothetical protein